MRQVADSQVNCSENKMEYLVIWEDYENEDATREQWVHLKKSREKVLLDFHKSYPRKPQNR